MDFIGKVLAGRYEIIEKVGEGGMATVYKGKDNLLNRNVAVKILKDEYASDETFVKRFKTEAQSAAALTHPNIVSVYDVGSEDGINYIVMELLESKTLKDYIEEKKSLPANEVLKISAQIASALSAAHRGHIIHRDIKPQNISLTDKLVAKVTDFGIAKITNVSSATITNFGNTVGSVHYFSPEHAKGGYTDEKSDIYSLGVVMYEMATGRLPFDADTPVAIALKHIQEEPIEPKELNDTIPDNLNSIILKAMAKNTAIRYKSADALLDDINEALDVQSRRKRNNVTTGETQVLKTVEGLENNNNKVPNLRMKEPRRIANNNVKLRDFDDKYKNIDEKKEKEKSKKKSKKILLIYIAIMTIIIIVFGILFVPKLYRKFSGSGIQTKEYEVPDLKGKKLADVVDAYKIQGIDVVQVGAEYSPDFEEGLIISQSIEAGTVSSISRIEVVVSKGTKMVEVPDVLSKDLNVAKYTLQDSAGFVIESTEEVNEKVEKGLIFSQEPAAGELVPYGSTVKLKISLGDGKKKYLMENLIGKTLDEAKKILEDNKLAVSIKYGEDASKGNGVVIAQSYPQNQELKEGDLVELTVNKVQISKEVTVSLEGLTNDIFNEEKLTATVKVMASVDSGAYNQVHSSTITASDKSVTFAINGFETAAIKVYIEDKVVKEETVKLK